jgi:hypothetical protein
VRWNHPQFGLISPASFIPIAEESGFIRELGRFVLDRATMKAAAWRTPDGRPAAIDEFSRHGIAWPFVAGAIRDGPRWRRRLNGPRRTPIT